MNSQQARACVAETFPQSFNRGKFIRFIRNLLNEIDESKAQSWNYTYVKDAFKNHVSRFERIGTYTSPNQEKLDVLIVHLATESKLECARTAIRNFVADHLKTRDEKDAALVAFVSPTEKYWRFSYVKMEYAAVENEDGKVGVQTKLTPARRSSYIVGENESCHTAQSRFLDLLQNTEHKPTLDQIEKAFSVETVTKEFFEQYKSLFLDLKDELEDLCNKDKTIGAEFAAKNVSTTDFAKKLMGQIVFLYFLQKKGWLGVSKGGEWGDGPHNFLRQLFDGKFGQHKNFFNGILEPLFYDTLATDRGHDAWCKIFNCRIPFLNGGLFEPLAGYDWRKTDIVIPDTLFSNTIVVRTGDIGTGILDVFDRYNFTVNEAEPLDKEVAIDPEMLGKVFENLLEVRERRSKGSFYTPREIVHYMCQESLINYLDTALNTTEKPLIPVKPNQINLLGSPEPEQTVLKTLVRREIVPRDDIETFIHSGDQISHYESVETRYAIKMPQSIKTNARLIDDKLADITVCDPAIGSGAFPVGMMQEIVRARSALTPYFNDVRERTAYHFKRYAIQNCLYGVDIDPGAVEIAKLRLWLSLVVDEDDVKQIKPLPNLDYKIVTGNSLLGVEKTLFNRELFERLEELKPHYFDATDQKQKEIIKHKIDDLIHKLTNGKEVFDFEIYFSEVFHRKCGFDVVIGNPPYLRVQGLQETQPDLVSIYKRKFKAASGSFDLYGLFIEQGFGLLKQDGHFAYIVPHKFFQATFGKGLRALLNGQRALKQIVRFGAEQVFDEPSTYTCLLFLSKRPQESFQLFEVKTLSEIDRVFTSIKHRQKADSYKYMELITPTTDDWDFHTDGGNKIMEKLKSESVSLGDITRKIFQGIATSADKIYILKFLEWEKNTVRCFSKRLEREIVIEQDLVKPILMGKNVHRYRPLVAENMVIFPYFIQCGQKELMNQKFIRENFPLGWEYLKENKKELSARESGKMEGNEFYAYIYPKNLTEFEVVKIITPDICDRPQMSLDESAKFYHTTTLYSFVFKNGVKDNPKYFLGILNSRLLWYFISVTGTVMRGGYLRFKTEYLKPFPIRCSQSRNPPTQEEQNKIIKLVDRILSAKQRDANTDTSVLERDIDELVYALYGLTPEEIKLVEGATKG